MSRQTSLLNLPHELQTEILRILVPRDTTFRVNYRRSCVPTESDAVKHEKKSNSVYIKYPYELPPGTYTRRSLEEQAAVSNDLSKNDEETDVDNTVQSVVSLLLIHPSLKTIVTQLLWSNNSFSFPDVSTLRDFAASLDASQVHLVTSISIDACGRARRPKTCPNTFVFFGHSADLDIVNALQLFPGLREVMLGGVGPGLSWAHFVRPSNFNEGCTEFLNNWDLDCARLVARIVGCDELDVDGTVGSDDAGESDKFAEVGIPGAATKLTEVVARTDRHHQERVPGPLEGGHVFFTASSTKSRPNRPYRGISGRSGGWFRWYGTRIVRRGERWRLKEHEAEAEDVPALLAVAKKHRIALDEKIEQRRHMEKTHRGDTTQPPR